MTKPTTHDINAAIIANLIDVLLRENIIGRLGLKPIVSPTGNPY